MRAILILILITLTENSIGLAQTYHITIHTNYGDMRAVLYDDTPKHRDEFLRLVRKKHFDGTLFYRVVKNFVIQGGSSDSRNAKPGQHIGYGDEAVNIDSEFSNKHFHKLGALCAPRQPDKVNMLKTSDISQFYIVRGRTYPDSILTKMEKAINNPIKRRIKEQFLVPHREELARLKTSDKKAYNALATEIKEKMEFEYRISGYKEFTPEQREAYTTAGGTPELDGEYTVFGQITLGIEVLKKINNLKVDKNDRPLTDVKISITIDEE
ncbi:MAG: peptidylprolyl isomerase [Marinilabiliaceae bacterium]|nr:peptidylprolyl isomerase [Marinilabiliaceae bacterium]